MTLTDSVLGKVRRPHLRLAVTAAGAATAAAVAGKRGAAKSRPPLAPGPSPWEGFVAPKPSYPHIVIERNVPIEMEDGVILRADVRYPADAKGEKAPGPFPVVVTSHCYNKGIIPTMTNYPAYGYVLVVVDVRGTGCSDGKWGILDDRECQDAYNIIEWAGTQPFSNGKVGVEGFSYLGASSALTAATRPPHLVAASFGGAPTDRYRTILTQGGNPASSAILWFILEMMGIAPTPFTLEARDGFKIIAKNPLKELGIFARRLLLNGSSIPFRFKLFFGVLSEKINWDNEFWRERATDTSKIDVPTLVYTGWEDLFQRDTPRDFRSLQMDTGRKKMVVGPWTHYSFPKHIGVRNNQPIDDVLVGWFDKWLKGIDNGIDHIDPILLWEYGSEKWVGHKSWPAENTRHERLYLTGDTSGTSGSVNDGTLADTAPERDGSSTMRVNPFKGFGTRQTMQFLGGLPVYSLPSWEPPFVDKIFPGMRKDDRRNERGALTFTSAPVAGDVAITGTLAVTLRGSTTAADPVWVARLSDVGPDGKARPISQGALVASRRELDPERTIYAPNGDAVEPFHWHTQDKALPVTSGEVQTYNIEIWPASWLLRKGHRLRLTIDGAEVPHLWPTSHIKKRLGNLTAHFGPNELSYLSVPVQLGTFERPAS